MSITRSRIPRRPKGLGGLLVTVLLGGLAACASDTAPTPPGRPMPSAEGLATTALESPRSVRPPFFEVLGRGGANLAVLGTVHLGPSDGWLPSAPIEAAIERADRFAMELDLRALDPSAVGDTLVRLAFLPVGRRLDDVVSPETARLLEEHDALLARYGMPRNARVSRKPWYVAVGVLDAIAQASGYDLARSADAMVLARIGDRPLLGLETFEEQLEMFDTLDLEAQDAILRDTVARLPEATQDIETLVSAWRSADREELIRLSRLGADALPALEAFFDRLLDERNRRWVDTLSRLLDDPALAGQQAFVAVGALHTVGDGGLETLFREAGYTVTRIH